MQLEHVERAAWRGTNWLIGIGWSYSLFETKCAVMHIEFCKRLYGRNGRMAKLGATLRGWVQSNALARVLEGRPLSNALNDSSLLIFLGFLDALGYPPDATALRHLLDRLRCRFERNVHNVRRLDVAADYWVIAYALALHGVEVRTEPLNRLAGRLPRVSSRIEPESRQFVDAFNYAIHRVLFETRYLRVVTPQLATDPCVQWLRDSWERTSMRSEIEYASDFLTSMWAVGIRVPRNQIENCLTRIAKQQTPTGCWPLATGDSRYNRFHSTWCATEALHLGPRMLRAGNRRFVVS